MKFAFAMLTVLTAMIGMVLCALAVVIVAPMPYDWIYYTSATAGMLICSASAANAMRKMESL